jgi:Ca-activated chloride channel family protein
MLRKRLFLAAAALCAALFFPGLAHAQSQAKRAHVKLPRVQQLDRGVSWQRDAGTGELHIVTRPERKSGPGENDSGDTAGTAKPIEVITQMVPVTCSVYTAEGDPVPGLDRAAFRVFDNGVEQKIAYFDASNQPASVAMIIDASPSVLRDTGEMKQAAEALVDALAPLDQAAVADFSAHTYLQLPFSDVRELIRRAVARVDPRQILGDTGGSNIYEAVYLVAHDLFAGRQGRKSIVLLTDGQDSGLGLTLDPASASPEHGAADNRLTFDDVTTLLASEDIQVFAVSTENRPKIMTPDWLAAHASATLLTRSAREESIPPYTLYLAELVRRAGGELYFLREKQAMADTFREIARKIRAEYTLGFYPSAQANAAEAARAASSTEGGAAASGWHQLRVEIVGQADARATYRTSYYVSSQN